MSSRKKGPHVPDQHFALGDDFMKPTPRDRRVRKETNDSSGEKSAELTSLQSTLPRRLRGRPAKKRPSVERGCSEEKTCTAKKKLSTGKDHAACESHAARNRQVRKVTNDSSEEKSAELTSLQSTLPRRPRGRPAKKRPSVERGCSEEKTCTAKKKLSTGKDHAACESHAARNRQVRKVTNDSSEEKSAELTSLQSTLPRRPRGRPAKKRLSVERGCSEEKTCTTKKKPSTGKDHAAYKSHAARKYYVVVGDPLAKTILIEEGSSDDEERPATGERSSAQKPKLKEQLSVKRPRFSEKSPSVKKHLSAEKHLPTQRGCLMKKRRLTGKSRFTEEGGLSERDSYGKRGRPIERGQSAKKGLYTKKVPSLEKGYLDGRGSSRESHRPEEKNHTAKKRSCTERDLQLERDRSMKRRLSTEEDHPVGRGWPAKKSHLAEKGSSTNKSRSARRGRPIKRHPTGRGCHIQTRPGKEGPLVEGGNTVDKRPSTGKDHPSWRSQPQKKSPPAEERPLLEMGNTVEERLSTENDHPRGRSQPLKKSCPSEEGPLVEKGNTAEVTLRSERSPSTEKDHPRGISRPLKKSHPADEGQSADRGPSAAKHGPTSRGRPPKKNQCAEKHLSAERICPPKKSCPEEKDLSSKRICSAEEVHSEERGHLAEKKGQLSDKKESMAKICSRESVAFQDSDTNEESNIMENVCSVEKGHHSMEKDFPVAKPSSGSMRTSPMQKHMKNTPESRIGSGSSKVPQRAHQKVTGAVTTGQRTQPENTRREIELKLPKELKACLIEDWKLINKHKQLFQLPAVKNVDSILANYVTFVKSQQKGDDMEYSVDELVYGIREYFNKMLGTHLLCPYEKPQYAGVMLASPKTPLSQIYGAPHLLRLFANIGSIFAKSSLNKQSLTLVSTYMHNFLDYLAKNSASLFSASNYKSASAMSTFKFLRGSDD